jgi:3-oxoacyl-(acyl-carrier-protein) synthase
LIGYTQGACGVFEVAAACLAFHEPTNWITYGSTQSPRKASVALVNCVGFGGKNSALILRGT